MSAAVTGQISPAPTPTVAEKVAAVRAEVCDLHAELTRYALVVWTAGNVSARVPGEELMVIKPSGLAYAELTPESMVVTNLDGTPAAGDWGNPALAPSSDTAACRAGGMRGSSGGTNSPSLAATSRNGDSARTKVSRPRSSEAAMSMARRPSSTRIVTL